MEGSGFGTRYGSVQIMMDPEPELKNLWITQIWNLFTFKVFGLLFTVFGLIIQKSDTLSMGGDQSAMEPSWTMVSVIGYGNWDRIVFPANICSSRQGCGFAFISSASGSGSGSRSSILG
jgi:hypothetical protein